MTKKWTFILLGWWFINTWPGSVYPTSVGPFRTLSQCNLMKQDTTLVGSIKSPCHNNQEPRINRWWFFYKMQATVPPSGQIILPPGLGFPSQAECDQKRQLDQANGGVVSATCWWSG